MATNKKTTPRAKVSIARLDSADAGLKNCTVRVRMYRHGLGDCFLLSFPRKKKDPFHMLIDFGALNRDSKHMLQFAEEIERATKRSGQAKSRLDLVVATHEHKDHLSGFNQAREVFDRMDIGGVWMGWTEDPEDKEAQRLSAARGEAVSHLRAALDTPLGLAAAQGDGPLANVSHIMELSDGDDAIGKRTIAEALEYLRQRGEKAGHIKYFEPGTGPLTLDGVEGVKVYVLGPPRGDLLLASHVTKKAQEEEIVYHLRHANDASLAANRAALPAAPGSFSSSETDKFHPFTREHRIKRGEIWWDAIESYIGKTYDKSGKEWRRIDEDWLGAFDQLALKLADDTNNTSLVLAFEIVKTREVLLFVGDAQVGNWQSWANVEFKLAGSDENLSAHDLLRRTVFYKVGHHASHNATLKKGGLELMKSPKLVAFVPLDKATAAKQGKKDPETQKPRGWQMPAKALYTALKQCTADRIVISDASEPLSPAAKAAGVRAEPTYCEFKL